MQQCIDEFSNRTISLSFFAAVLRNGSIVAVKDIKRIQIEESRPVIKVREVFESKQCYHP